MQEGLILSFPLCVRVISFLFCLSRLLLFLTRALLFFVFFTCLQLGALAIRELATRIPQGVGMMGIPMAQKLRSCLVHQHAEVRSSGLQALGDILNLHNTYDALEELMPVLRKMVTDRSSVVREVSLSFSFFCLRVSASSFLCSFGPVLG